MMAARAAPAPAGGARVRLRVEPLEAREVPTAALDTTYISTLYQGLLGHAPDAVGLNFWMSQLNAGLTRADVAFGITQSPEFRAHQVQFLYQSLLGRPADPAGLAFFTNQLLFGGTINGVKAAIMGSPEFFVRSGGNFAGFLDAVYRAQLLRAPDAQGNAFWGAALFAGITPGTVALGILNTAESTRVKIDDAYLQVLGRLPESFGLNFWTTALQNGNHEEFMIAGVLGSGEYLNQLQTFLDQNSSITNPTVAANQFIVTTGRFRTAAGAAGELGTA
jgi:hypothetical protein